MHVHAAVEGSGGVLALMHGSQAEHHGQEMRRSATCKRAQQRAHPHGAEQFGAVGVLSIEPGHVEHKAVQQDQPPTFALLSRALQLATGAILIRMMSRARLRARGRSHFAGCARMGTSKAQSTFDESFRVHARPSLASLATAELVG